MRRATVLAERIRARVDATVYGESLQLARLQQPAGDPGLFGPDSMVWRVHSNMLGMFTGGLAALLLQTLHPLAVAGVDQHSVYRQDPVGRLNRTAGFIAVTSFGPSREARAALARVRRRHDRVRGAAPDGRPYAAGDPALLTWVHVAETRCFLAGHQAYGGRRLTTAQCDRYFRETAVLAEHLGATAVPASMADVRSYLASVRSELAPSDAGLATVGFLRGLGRDPLERAALRVLLNGAGALLPDWAAQQLDLDRPGPALGLLHRAATHALGAVLRYACEPSPILETARTRANTPPAHVGSPQFPRPLGQGPSASTRTKADVGSDRL
ncbi:oxygenase MpaB family protein [Kitasatospora sp. NPDC058218]|uniref:oxygenase MpaB family protein n=1 Tax=Kitasatospora sp. NPDC058218 TaxID=3346385 RepID=UPI0036DEB85B